MAGEGDVIHITGQAAAPPAAGGSAFNAGSAAGMALPLLGTMIGLSENRRNRQYQTYMANTAYRRAVTDMRAAGLNPALMFGGARGADTPSTQPFNPEGMGRDFNSARMMAAQTKSLEASAAYNSAQATAVSDENNRKAGLYDATYEDQVKTAKALAERAAWEALTSSSGYRMSLAGLPEAQYESDYYDVLNNWGKGEFSWGDVGRMGKHLPELPGYLLDLVKPFVPSKRPPVQQRR